MFLAPKDLIIDTKILVLSSVIAEIEQKEVFQGHFGDHIGFADYGAILDISKWFHCVPCP